MGKPKVSVIVPSRTKKEYEERLKPELEKQDYPNYEVVTVFGKEITEAWNIGKEKASGDIILFTETDVELPEDWISRMVENVQANDGFAMGSEVVASSRAWTFSTVGVSKDILKDMKFDEYLKRAGDTDFFEQIKDRGFKIKREREPVVYHDKGGDPKSELKWSFYRGMYYVYIAAKHQPNPDMSFPRIFKSRAFHLTKEVLQLLGVIIGLIRHFPTILKNKLSGAK